jgi:hypothetical protein
VFEELETFWRNYCVQNPERPVGFFLQEGTPDGMDANRFPLKR